MKMNRIGKKVAVAAIFQYPGEDNFFSYSSLYYEDLLCIYPASP